MKGRRRRHMSFATLDRCRIGRKVIERIIGVSPIKSTVSKGAPIVSADSMLYAIIGVLCAQAFLLKIIVHKAGRSGMHVVVNVQDKKPDEDQRSLRARVSGRESDILRDTYRLIDGENSPSKRLTMGHTTIYPTGTTTGHAHDDMEEVYFVISGEGIMVIGEERFEIKPGDGLYVPPGMFHTTLQTGNQPLTVLWVTCRIDAEDME